MNLRLQNTPFRKPNIILKPTKLLCMSKPNFKTKSPAKSSNKKFTSVIIHGWLTVLPSLLMVLSVWSFLSWSVQLVSFSPPKPLVWSAITVLRWFQVVVHGSNSRPRQMVVSTWRSTAVVKSQSPLYFALLALWRMLISRRNSKMSTLVRLITSTPPSIRTLPALKLLPFSKFTAVSAQVTWLPLKTLVPWLNVPSSTINVMTTLVSVVSRLTNA